MTENASLCPRLTFSAINCNSLNISTISSFHHKLKIYGITKLRTDIIFLSDIRIPVRDEGANVKKIASSFLSNPYGSYEFFFNSNNSSRGVGILINKKLDFSVEAIERDAEHNILGLAISLEGKKLFLMAVMALIKYAHYFLKIWTKFWQNTPHTLAL
jgi:exonuclease III